MASTGKKWLAGCAIGCVVLLGILGLVGVAGFMVVSSTVEGFQQAEESRARLAETHGSITAFTPPTPDGLPADRLHTFIQVRQSLEGPQRDLETTVRSFPDRIQDGNENPLRTIFQVFRGLPGLLRPMGEYIQTRNRLLLENNMGQGEYLFYYGLVYYAWLGHVPDEAPDLGGSHGDSKFSAGPGAAFGPAQARLRYRYYTQAMMRNLAEAQSGTTDRSQGTAAGETTAELRRFEQDPDHIAWSSPLPPAWQATLEPRRAELEPSYSPIANIFEWPRRAAERRRGLTFDVNID